MDHHLIRLRIALKVPHVRCLYDPTQFIVNKLEEIFTVFYLDCKIIKMKIVDYLPADAGVKFVDQSFSKREERLSQKMIRIPFFLFSHFRFTL